MHSSGIIESFVLIFTGAALLATVALYTRQPVLVAYIAIGCLLGPHGMGYVADAELLSEIAEIGIIFLLFLVGLDLPPAKLKNMAGRSLVTALGTSAVFFLVACCWQFWHLPSPNDIRPPAEPVHERWTFDKTTEQEGSADQEAEADQDVTSAEPTASGDALVKNDTPQGGDQ